MTPTQYRAAIKGRTQMNKQWAVCDATHGENPCLYSQNGIQKLKGNHARCIKHGNLLDYFPSLDGMTREQIRRKWKAEAERGAA